MKLANGWKPDLVCFSAQASFLAAGLTGAAGCVAVARAPQAKYLAVASIPLAFAVQQGLEGAVWLGLEGGASAEQLSFLSAGYLIIGEAAWPLFVPVAVLLAEPSIERRKGLRLFAVAGFGLFTLFTLLIASAEYTPVIQNGCICYEGRVEWSLRSMDYGLASDGAWRLSNLDWTVAPYAAVTIGSLLMSSHAPLRAFGVASGVGLAASLLIYRETLVSVWCFFAALGSVIVVVAIEHIRSQSVRFDPPDKSAQRPRVHGHG